LDLHYNIDSIIDLVFHLDLARRFNWSLLG